MGGKGGGGQADPSGMYAAMASRSKLPNKNMLFGKEQLDWTKQVWAQEQPLVDQAGADADYSRSG